MLHNLTLTHNNAILTHRGSMRTNIDIDDALMDEAITVSGEPTKRAVVERALRLLIDTYGQASIRQMRGKAQWRGDLGESRRSRAVASR